MKKKLIHSLCRYVRAHGSQLLKMMKVTSMLLLVGCLHLSAKSLSQTIRLQAKGMALTQVLTVIEKQTGYHVVYNSQVVKNAKPVTVNSDNMPLASFLSTILTGQGFLFEISEKTIFIAASSNAPNKGVKSGTKPMQQQRSITGKVLSDIGKPLERATVKVPGSSVNTMTNDQGIYKLLVPGTADRLEFSMMGYQTAIKVIGTAEVIDVILNKSVDELSEIVVVGYGSQKKIHVTGSVAQVTAQELTKVPMPNISQLLTGRLPGVVFQQQSGQPGADEATMLVRGYGTFNNSSPLMLVDGVERSFGHIDPSEIESVSVLKDAAASAVYGVKGAHGVILVTTKRGKTGNKPVLSYSGSATISENTMLPAFLTGTEYAKWHNRANELDGNKKWFSEQQIEKMSNGDPSDGLENTNWQKEFMGKLAPMNQHNISVSGGTDNVRYFTSIGTMAQGGIVKDMSFKRHNARANVDMNPNKDWLISLNLSGRMEKSYMPGAISYEKQALFSPISQALYMYPFVPFTYKGMPTGSSYMTLNPFAAAELSGFKESSNAIIETSGRISYTPSFIQGLNLSLFGSYDRRYGNAKSFATPYTVYTYLAETGVYAKSLSDGFIASGNLMQSADNFDYTVLRPSVEYSKSLGEHQLSALFLFEYQKGNSNSMYATRWGYPITAIPELSFGQLFPPVPNSGGSNETVQAGFVGRLNYAYTNKYLMELSFRQDASYKFPPHSRWGLFPSLSLGWVVSEENFFKDQFSNVDRLKIRASAGILGQDNVNAFLYDQYFNLTSGPVAAFGKNLVPLYGLRSSTSYPSTDLTWEKTKTYNIGLELSMWKGLLSAEIDGFYKYTYDILQSAGNVYPSSLGGNFPAIENSGSVDARGFEIQLSHKHHINDFNYRISGNMSYSKNRILSMIQTENIHPWQSMIGRSIGQRMVYVADGLYQSEQELLNSPAPPGGGYKRLGDIRYKDLNGDGKLTRQDDMAVGTRPGLPPVMYAFNIDLNYKNFDFAMMWQGAAGNDILLSGMYDHGIPDNTIFTTAFYGNGYNSPRYLLEDSWTPEHPNARYPRLSLVPSGGNSLDSSWWIENGSYLRLKNISLGYSFSKEMLSKIKIQQLRLYLAGSNIFTLAKFKYLDPESPSVNNGYYPQQRTFSLGLNLNF
jgi:TonB-linked SusC/RagA family outer membrane protein